MIMNRRRRHIVDLFTKFILNFLSIITLIAQFICGLIGFLLIFASIALLFISTELQHKLLTSMNTSSNITIWGLLVTCMIAIAIIICLFIIANALSKIIKNIYKQHYFVTQNLKYLKFILISIICFTLLQFISQMFFTDLSLHNVSSIFSDSSPGLFGNILLIAIVYTVYVTFKYGIYLQEESNHVI